MLSQSGGGASSFRTPFSLYLDIPKKVYTSILWKGRLNAGRFRELSFRLLVHHLPFGPSISFGEIITKKGLKGCSNPFDWRGEQAPPTL